MVFYAQLTHNSAPHPALSVGINQCYTPAEVFLGRKLITRLNKMIMADFEVELFDVEKYIQYLQQILPRIRSFAKES